MATPESTPVRHAKLGIGSSKSSPLSNEYKKLLSDQHQRLTTKHQQDLDLIDDIRGYVKARLSIERDYTGALNKLAKNHSSHINKKFTLLSQCDTSQRNRGSANNEDESGAKNDDEDARIRKRLVNNGQDTQPDKPSSLYKVWSEHINRLEQTSKNRADQFEQLILIVDKLKDIRTHKATIGKKCLYTHLKRIHEELLASMVDVERARKLYYEDESQAKKARENEEKIKKKRSGLLTKFTDLQAKKEKTSAQREANDIQSTQARNDYIMSLAAANAHLQHYYQRDLSDFIHLIDDGVLDHCKIFMATLSECDINSLKDALHHAQFWSKLINLTGSQQTNTIFLECEQSACLQARSQLEFEPYNNDPICGISLEHNADYALQHEIDKWFTWFKKECRNLSQLVHQLDTCQHAFAEGKRSIELNGQNVEDLEAKVIDLKQQIRKSEAAKLKAQARLKVIKEGGMQIEEWSTVESEIRADMARAQEEQMRTKRLKEIQQQMSAQSSDGGTMAQHEDSMYNMDQQGHHQVRLQISKESNADRGRGDGGGGGTNENDSDDMGTSSIHNLASVSRSTSNLVQKQQNAISGYSALTDPSLVWQDDYSNAWASGDPGATSNVVVTDSIDSSGPLRSPKSPRPQVGGDGDAVTAATAQGGTTRNDLLSTSKPQQNANASTSIQSSSPLSAIVVNGQHLSQSPYQGFMGEAYKSDYECDYNRPGQQHLIRSAASSAEPSNHNYAHNQHYQQHGDSFGGQPPDEAAEFATSQQQQVDQSRFDAGDSGWDDAQTCGNDVTEMLNKRVVALYNFDKNNDDDLAFRENDILFVDELTDDANWIKARNETTGDEGYIPSSYVRLQQNLNANMSNDGSGSTQRNNNTNNWDANDSNTYAAQEKTNQTVSKQSVETSNKQDEYSYCRALYDHKPEENTFEEDGWPHLSLAQNEIMRIIDQGDDDGWWLVEKEDTGVKGHVPSMLVEELGLDNDYYDDNEEEDEEQDDEEMMARNEASGESLAGGLDDHAFPSAPPPMIEPPVLTAESIGDNELDVEAPTPSEPEKDCKSSKEPSYSEEGMQVADTESDISEKQQRDSQQPQQSSLIPTSFIIIEPTPEVESKRIEDIIADFKNSTEIPGPDSQDSDGGNAGVVGSEDEPAASEREPQTPSSTTFDRPVVKAKPPSGVSYSVINEDFVLERPTKRAPNCLQSDHQSHETPTILEESIVEETPATSKIPEVASNTYEPLSEVDSVEIQAPPSVVIESFEDDNPEGDKSESGEGDEAENTEDETNSTSAYGQQRQVGSDYVEKKIKQTTNVDVSPILRHKADEFSKQIIEEAIMLAPGADIGPSTSSLACGDIDHYDNNIIDDGSDDDKDGMINI